MKKTSFDLIIQKCVFFINGFFTNSMPIENVRVSKSDVAIRIIRSIEYENSTRSVDLEGVRTSQSDAHADRIAAQMRKSLK